jgi:hypothetical protein
MTIAELPPAKKMRTIEMLGGRVAPLLRKELGAAGSNR